MAERPSQEQGAAAKSPPASKPPSDSHSDHESDAGSDGAESVAAAENPGPQHLRRPIKSGVRYYNLRGFFNRIEDDDWDYTIEVLVARPNWAREAQEETDRRARLAEGLDVATEEALSGRVMAASPERFGEGRKMQLVRIRSPTVLKLLGELANWTDSSFESTDMPIVFGRPFRTLEYCHGAMKQKLAEAEAAEAEEMGRKVQAAVVTDAPPSQPISAASQLQPDESAARDTEGPQELDTGRSSPRLPTPLEDLRVYVDFVESVILPMWERFQGADRRTPLKVLYTEIPFLFKPGDLAYVPPPPNRAMGSYPAATQTIFRVLYCVPRDLPHDLRDDGVWDLADTKTSVYLQCLDFDGERFFSVYTSAGFSRYFEDEVEVTSLPCYPLRFHPDCEALMDHHMKLGDRFRTHVEGEVQCLYYSGWTLGASTLPKEDDDDDGTDDGHDDDAKKMKTIPEYVESEVILDFKEASRRIRDGTPREAPSFSASALVVRRSVFQTLHWAKGEAGPLRHISGGGALESFLVREDNVHAMAAKAFFRNDSWVGRDKPAKSPQWSPHDLAILPRRVLGYVLQRRMFARLDLQNLEARRKGRQASLEDIQMTEAYRKILRSTVWSHFDRRQKEKHSLVSEYQPDIIQGKGKGVVILLHGAPGVGKTSTAEVVAQEFAKPLFPITCGDLGTKPKEVEETLRDIFHYAHIWECVLLLDEADVFLTQRDRYNIERNALVSVFLRMLEYYSGILFLTTNRVGALDEAFRSRIHLSLYYPHLSEENTIAILNYCLRRLPRVDNVGPGETIGPSHIQVQDEEIERFVRGEFDRFHKKHKRGPWNGRQIRNAVQIASCLALYEAQKKHSSNVRPVLTSADFKTVFDTSAEFDRYLKEARRADESMMAHIHGDRADKFDQQKSHGADGPSHEPTKFEPEFASAWDRETSAVGAVAGAGAGTRNGRQLPEPHRLSGRQYREHSPIIRGNSNQHLGPIAPRDAGHYDLARRRQVYDTDPDHSPSVRGRNNQRLSPVVPRDAGDYELAAGRPWDDRRLPDRDRYYRTRAAEDEARYGAVDERDDMRNPDADRRGLARVAGASTLEGADPDLDGYGDVRDRRGEAGMLPPVRGTTGPAAGRGGLIAGEDPGGDPRSGPRVAAAAATATATVAAAAAAATVGFSTPRRGNVPPAALYDDAIRGEADPRDRDSAGGRAGYRESHYQDY